MPISHYFCRYFYGVTRDVNKAKVRCKWAVFDFFPIMPFGPCPTPPDPKYWGSKLVIIIIGKTINTMGFHRPSRKRKFSSVICQSSVSIKRLTSACWFEVRGIHCTSKWILDRIQILKIPPHWRSVLYANTHVRTWEIGKIFFKGFLSVDVTWLCRFFPVCLSAI